MFADINQKAKLIGPLLTLGVLSFFFAIPGVIVCTVIDAWEDRRG